MMFLMSEGYCQFGSLRYELSEEHFQILVETEAWNRNQSGTWSIWMDIKTMWNCGTMSFSPF